MFVDTGAWYAAYVRNDAHHEAVKLLIDDTSTRLVTTDFILAETLNLLRARNEFDRAVILGNELLANGAAQLVQVERDDLQKAFVVFATYRDKKWSFTDCTSLVVMQRLNMKAAITLDKHFQQMPGITVYP